MPDEDQDHVVIAAGEVSLTATAFDANDNPVAATPTWESLAPAIATVDANAVVTAEGNGTALIVASVSGKADTAVVMVQQHATSLTLVPTAARLTAFSATVRLLASALDANQFPIATPDLVWTSTASDIVTVDPTGLGRALAAYQTAS